MLTHKPVNRYLASKDAESAGAEAPDGASPRRLRTPPRSVTSTFRLSCRRFIDVTEQCAASVCSHTIEKYQYGCTFSHKKYSHTGILSAQEFCHSWNVLCDNYFRSDAAMKSHVQYCFFCRNLVLSPVLRLFPAGRRCSSWRVSSPLSSP